MDQGISLIIKVFTAWRSGKIFSFEILLTKLCFFSFSMILTLMQLQLELFCQIIKELELSMCKSITDWFSFCYSYFQKSN